MGCFFCWVVLFCWEMYSFSCCGRIIELGMGSSSKKKGTLEKKEPSIHFSLPCIFLNFHAWSPISIRKKLLAIGDSSPIVESKVLAFEFGSRFSLTIPTRSQKTARVLCFLLLMIFCCCLLLGIGKFCWYFFSCYVSFFLGLFTSITFAFCSSRSIGSGKTCDGGQVHHTALYMVTVFEAAMTRHDTPEV